MKNVNNSQSDIKIIIIGAGPAGLTAAFELSKHQGFKIVIIEATETCGGISKTVNYKGNRIDIGGHRFFSKSDWVMKWWQNIMPIHPYEISGKSTINYQGKNRDINLAKQDIDNHNRRESMLLRNRLSRIFFEGQLLRYPVRADMDTALKLGPKRILKILYSYVYARLNPRKPEKSLEDFLVNRFGVELYLTFFKEYTGKVWGKKCTEISADWGAQRIKGLSISRAIITALKKIIIRSNEIDNKNIETTLIERFLYPAKGPGQLWEKVAAVFLKKGGEIQYNKKVVGMEWEKNFVRSVVVQDVETGKKRSVFADFVISTMPVRDLISGFHPPAPDNVLRVAKGLEYRDFITIGLLLKKMNRTKGVKTTSHTNIIPDNWIYIQDKGVKMGRVQIFNNWSPYMVADENTVWVGLEYFCNEGDSLWSKTEGELVDLGSKEIEKIGLADRGDVLDSIVIKMPKTYPGYYGTFDEFEVIKDFTDQLHNLFLIGRNGMHRYNNQDHSMLTARFAVETILEGKTDKSKIWDVNIGDDYHEE